MNDDGTSHAVAWMAGVLCGLIFGIWLTVDAEHAKAIDAHVAHYVLNPDNGDSTFTWGPAQVAPPPAPTHP